MLEKQRLNGEQFAGVVAEATERAASAKQDGARWTRAIVKASEYLTAADVVWYLTDSAELMIVSPQSGELYEVSAKACNAIGHDGAVSAECSAAHRGQPCWHRAAWKLTMRYAAAPAETFAACSECTMERRADELHSGKCWDCASL